MKMVCQELVDFFEQGEGWDKSDVLIGYVQAVIAKADCGTKWADELTVNDGEECLMVLSEFAEALFDEIIEGVCNVIKTA